MTAPGGVGTVSLNLSLWDGKVGASVVTGKVGLVAPFDVPDARRRRGDSSI